MKSIIRTNAGHIEISSKLNETIDSEYSHDSREADGVRFRLENSLQMIATEAKGLNITVFSLLSNITPYRNIDNLQIGGVDIQEIVSAKEA